MRASLFLSEDLRFWPTSQLDVINIHLYTPRKNGDKLEARTKASIHNNRKQSTIASGRQQLKYKNAKKLRHYDSFMALDEMLSLSSFMTQQEFERCLRNIVVICIFRVLKITFLLLHTLEIKCETRDQSNLAKVAGMHHTQLSRVTDRMTDRHREHRNNNLHFMPLMQPKNDSKDGNFVLILKSRRRA